MPNASQSVLTVSDEAAGRRVAAGDRLLVGFYRGSRDNVDRLVVDLMALLDQVGGDPATIAVDVDSHAVLAEAVGLPRVPAVVVFEHAVAAYTRLGSGAAPDPAEQDPTTRPSSSPQLP